MATGSIQSAVQGNVVENSSCHKVLVFLIISVMVKELEPTPTSTPEGKKKLPAHEVLQNYPPPRRRGRGASNGRASFADYEKMLSDKPTKFSAAEVNYREAEGSERCKLCFHFFTQGGGDRRTVCEIFRPTGEDENVDPNYVCDFFTKESEEYPLLGEKQ